MSLHLQEHYVTDTATHFGLEVVNKTKRFQEFSDQENYANKHVASSRKDIILQSPTASS